MLPFHTAIYKQYRQIFVLFLLCAFCCIMLSRLLIFIVIAPRATVRASLNKNCMPYCHAHISVIVLLFFLMLSLRKYVNE